MGLESTNMNVKQSIKIKIRHHNNVYEMHMLTEHFPSFCQLDRFIRRRESTMRSADIFGLLKWSLVLPGCELRQISLLC